MRRKLVVCLIAAVAGASFALASDPPVCLNLEVRSDLPTTALFADGFEQGDVLAWRLGSPTFSASEILDVLFNVAISGDIHGDHLVQVRIDAPDGHHYQTLTAPVTSDLSRGGTLVRVMGYPHPLRIQTMKLVTENGNTLQRVVTSLPVAGTAIVANSLYGTWIASALLDGREAACEGPARFGLVE